MEVNGKEKSESWKLGKISNGRDRGDVIKLVCVEFNCNRGWPEWRYEFWRLKIRSNDPNGGVSSTN